MLEFVGKLLQQLSSFFKGLPAGRKFSLILVILLSIAGFTTIIIIAGMPDFEILYTNLSPNDAGEIVAKLKDMKIPYELSANGSSIMVPAEKVYEVRLQLAGQGLPQGSGIGFEIFDQTNFGMTEFLQKLNYQRALQGELSRTINQLSEIEQSRVHIVPAKEGLFKEDRRKATASVVVKLKPGGVLKEKHIQGIVHLIASAVEGLEPENITVIDTNGNILSSGASEADILQISRTHLEYQHRLEKTLENRIQSMLESVIGKNKAIARVSAQLDFQQVEKTEESFDPESQVARSEQRSEESTQSPGAGPAGAPGVASNIPGGMSAIAGGGAGATSQKTSETINYEINKTVKHVVAPPGNIVKLSVAVMIDGTYDGKEKKYNARSEEEMKKYEGIVKTAVGYDEKRGDSIQVTNVPFEIAYMEEDIKAMEKEATREFWFSIIHYVVIAGVILAVVFIILKPLINWLTLQEARTGVTTGFPKTVEELEVELAEGKTEAKKESLRDKIKEVVAKNPEIATELVRKWLRERG